MMKAKLLIVLALLMVLGLEGVVLAGGVGGGPAVKADGVSQTQRRRRKKKRVRKARSYAIKVAPEPPPPPPPPPPEPEASAPVPVQEAPMAAPDPPADPASQGMPGTGGAPKKSAPRIKPPTVQIKPPTR